MIIKRQKLYTGLKRKAGARVQRVVLNAFKRGLKTKVGGKVLPKIVNQGVKTEKGVEAVNKTVKTALLENAGKGTRRAAAGTVINPGLTAATVIDPVLAAKVPAYNAVPINLKAAAISFPVKTPTSVQKFGRDMMKEHGKTAPSKVGKAIEITTNAVVPIFNHL